MGHGRRWVSSFFLLICFWKSCFVIVGPFSASPRAGAKPGRSHGSWLRPGFAPAPGEAEKGPKTAKNDFQKFWKFPEFPENCWPHSGWGTCCFFLPCGYFIFPCPGWGRFQEVILFFPGPVIFFCPAGYFFCPVVIYSFPVVALFCPVVICSFPLVILFFPVRGAHDPDAAPR